MQYYEKENFPDFGEYSSDLYFEIKEKDPKRINRQIAVLRGLTNNRVMLKSCSFSVKDDEVEAVCLDGFRIAVSKKKNAEPKGRHKFYNIRKS